LTLLFAELVNNKAQVSVDLVVASQRSVHFVGVNTKVHDLLLSGCDRTLKLLDLEVQYVFELLQLLRFLLESINTPLFFIDLLVFLVDLLPLVVDLGAQPIRIFLLFYEDCLLFFDLAVVFVNFRVDFLHI